MGLSRLPPSQEATTNPASCAVEMDEAAARLTPKSSTTAITKNGVAVKTIDAPDAATRIPGVTFGLIEVTSR